MATEQVHPDADLPIVDVRGVLVNALMAENRKAMRCPRHWRDRLETIHATMDELVDQILELDRGR